MKNVISKITTIAECDALITTTQILKSDLEFKGLKLESSVRKLIESSEKVEVEISKHQQELEQLNSLINDDRETKEYYLYEKMLVEFRLYKLQLRLEKQGLVGIINKELELSRTISDIAVVTAHLSDLEAKKTELQSAA